MITILTSPCALLECTGKIQIGHVGNYMNLDILGKPIRTFVLNLLDK